MKWNQTKTEKKKRIFVDILSLFSMKQNDVKLIYICSFETLYLSSSKCRETREDLTLTITKQLQKPVYKKYSYYLKTIQMIVVV